MPKFIQPTRGRIVLVERTDGSTTSGVAIITKVWGDRCINVAGWNEHNSQWTYSSLTLVQDGDDIPAVGPYARWMDYQLGQAERTERAESALAEHLSTDT